MDNTFANVYRGVERLANAKVQIGGIWRKEIGDLKDYTDEYMRLAQAQFKFRGFGMSESDDQRAFARVEEVVTSLKGLRLDEATDDLSHLTTAFGNLGHAMDMLPLAEKYRFSFGTLFGDKFSKQQIEDQIQQGTKALEMMGVVSKGMDEVQRRFNIIAQMTASEPGGGVTPSAFFNLAKLAGPAAQNLSEEGLRALGVPIQELGGMKAGTGLFSMYKTVVGGTMNDAAKREWVRLGLVDPKKLVFGKHSNIIKSFKPGANLLADTFMTNPMEGISKVLEAAKAHGVDTSSSKHVLEELNLLFPNRTASRVAGLYGTQQQRIQANIQRSKDAPDIQGLYNLALQSPAGKLEEWEAAVTNFKAHAGKPMVDALTSIATAATPVMKFLGEHEALAKWAGIMVMAAKGASALAQTMAVLKMSGLADIFRAGGAAASGATEGAGQTGREMFEALFKKEEAEAAGQSAGRFGGMGIAGGLIAGVGIGLAAYGLEEIITAHLHGKELHQQAEEAGRELQESFKHGFDDLKLTGDKDQDKAAVLARGQELERQWAGNILDTLHLSEKEPSFFARLGGQTMFDLSPAVTSLQAEKNRKDRGLPETPEMKKAGEEAWRQMLEVGGKPIAGVGEFKEIYDKGSQALAAGGHGDLIATFQDQLRALYPALASQMDQITEIRQTEIQNLGLDADWLAKHADAAEQAADRLDKLGKKDDGGGGDPPTPTKPHLARGGIVMRPTYALVGEAGPEWIHSAHETRALLGRGGGSFHVDATGMIVNVGTAGAGDLARIREAAAEGVYHGAVRAMNDHHWEQEHMI
ncbi:MAG TPA: hypothetical protein VI756_25845 [Blastocatellia bacterium]